MHKHNQTGEAVDPGWSPAIKRYLLGWLTMGFYGRKQTDVDGLTIARLLFLTLLGAGYLLLVVSFFILPGIGEVDPSFLVLHVVIGTVSIVGAVWSRSRPLDLSDANSLAGSYRTSFFIGFAFSEASVLIAFGISMLKDEIWPLIVGLAFFTVAMALVAPGRSNLAHHQRRILSSGSGLLIADALMDTTPSKPGQPQSDPGDSR